jgi:CHAT domain-containing protein
MEGYTSKKRSVERNNALQSNREKWATSNDDSNEKINQTGTRIPYHERSALPRSPTYVTPSPKTIEPEHNETYTKETPVFPSSRPAHENLITLTTAGLHAILEIPFISEKKNGCYKGNDSTMYRMIDLQLINTKKKRQNAENTSQLGSSAETEMKKWNNSKYLENRLEIGVNPSGRKKKGKGRNKKEEKAE